MILTDKEIISKYQIGENDKVIDIGGSMRQHQNIKIDTLVDIIRPEQAPYGKSKLIAKKFVKVDVTKERLPFDNKEFDFCLCTHTLEDLNTPFLLIDEMSRIAKRGLVVTPSMGADIVFSHINFTDWFTGARRVPGHAHHKWLFYKKDGKVRIIPKNYPILYTSGFQIVGWSGVKEFEYYWEGKIEYHEIKDINFHQLIGIYRDFLEKNRSYIKRGPVLLYIDNPYSYFKEIVKLILKRIS